MFNRARMDMSRDDVRSPLTPARGKYLKNETVLNDDDSDVLCQGVRLKNACMQKQNDGAK